MRALTLSLVFSTLLFGSVAAAQPVQTPPLEEESTASLARQYIMMGGSEDLFVEGAAYGFQQAAEAGGLRLTPNQWQRVQAVVREGFAPAAEVFIGELEAFIASSAREDLIAALNFYNTPAGQRYVMATTAYSFPLSTYLASQGRIPLQDAPRADQLNSRKLAASRAVAALLIANLHEAERAQIDLTAFGVAGVEDFVARSLANSLEVSDLEAVNAWLSSPPSRRLEGPSAERTLRIQTASMRAMAAVDMPSLVARIQAIMREPPPT